MSDYTRVTDFTAKDALLTGNPSKLVKGEEIQDELDAIVTMSGQKANKLIPAITNSVAVLSASGDLVDGGQVIPSGTLVTTTNAVTLTNKTFTSPTINGGTADNVNITNASAITVVGNVSLGAGSGVIFEGTTDNTYEATLVGGDPTADRTLTLPDLTGTLVTESGNQSLSNKTIDCPTTTFSGVATIPGNWNFTGNPTGLGGVVLLSTTETLTMSTISGSLTTISNATLASVGARAALISITALGYNSYYSGGAAYGTANGGCTLEIQATVGGVGGVTYSFYPLDKAGGSINTPGDWALIPINMQLLVPLDAAQDFDYRWTASDGGTLTLPGLSVKLIGYTV